MADAGLLLLGPILFQDFETPAVIRFGGAQRLAIHRLPDGTRIIDSMGRDDEALTWSGIFSGDAGAERARLVDLLRAQGGVLPLTWDAFFYSVIISGFSADYTRSNWIPYRITCTVLRDEVAALIQATISLAASALADVTTAAGFTTGVNLGAPLAALTAPGADIAASAAYTSATATLASTSATLDAGVTNFSASLVTAPIATASGLGQAADAAGELAALTATRGYIRRAAVNMQNAST